MRKIPAYMYAPIGSHNRYGLELARKILELEAQAYRDGGQDEAARALRECARSLKLVSQDGVTIAQAFYFPVRTAQKGRRDSPCGAADPYAQGQQPVELPDREKGAHP